MGVDFVKDFVELVFGENSLEDSLKKNEKETLVQSLVLEQIVQTQNAWRNQTTMVSRI